MLNKKTIIVSHKYTTTPEDYLVDYLNRKGNLEVMQIKHSFSDATDRLSDYTLFKNGQIVKEGISSDLRGMPEPIIYFKELVFTLVSVFNTKTKWDDFIAIDGLCSFFGILLRKLGKVASVTYWAMDFVPDNRFSSKAKNYLYRKINTYAYLHSDQVWDLSPRMAEARETLWGINQSSYKTPKVVPYGVWVDKVQKYTYEQCEKNTLVFMGHILEKMGTQKVIEAIPEIIKSNPDFKFKVIGGGEYIDTLKKLASDLKVANYCQFLGKIKDHRQLQKEIAKSCAAIAPYIKELDTWTYYADPGKIKEYLAAGVPVLLTNIPWNTQEIVKNQCGVVIESNPENIAYNVVEIMKPEINQKYRDNAVKYAYSFDFSHIFREIENEKI